MAEPVALKYRAFISYGFADTSWAKWLQRGLEGFRIADLPFTATSSLPVIRFPSRRLLRSMLPRR